MKRAFHVYPMVGPVIDERRVKASGMPHLYRSPGSVGHLLAPVCWFMFGHWAGTTGVSAVGTIVTGEITREAHPIAWALGASPFYAVFFGLVCGVWLFVRIHRKGKGRAVVFMVPFAFGLICPLGQLLGFAVGLLIWQVVPEAVLGLLTLPIIALTGFGTPIAAAELTYRVSKRIPTASNDNCCEPRQDASG